VRSFLSSSEKPIGRCPKPLRMVCPHRLPSNNAGEMNSCASSRRMTPRKALGVASISTEWKLAARRWTCEFSEHSEAAHMLKYTQRLTVSGCHVRQNRSFFHKLYSTLT
jgi:hypothetical protein